MNENRIRREELFAQLPAEWAEDLLPAIQEKVRAAGRKVVALDDDPTGTQTVHGVAVLTRWPVERLVEEMERPEPVFYLLTNSRSLAKAEAEALNMATGEHLRQAQEQAALSGTAARSTIAANNHACSTFTHSNFAAISRSDSTLRGHFPGEVAALAQGLGEAFDAWLAELRSRFMPGWEKMLALLRRNSLFFFRNRPGRWRLNMYMPMSSP